MSQTTDTWMEYNELRRAGFSPTEIQEWMRPQLEEAGFADQEINAHFRQQEIADGTQEVTTEADILDYLLYGVQNSNFGLAYRKELPSALTPEQLEKATLGQRMALQFAQLVMDAPVYAVGGTAGTLVGGPGGGLAGAFAINAAVRAYYMERIAAGHTEDYNVLSGIAQVAKAVGNAGLTGIAVGKAGTLAGAAASRLGPGYATAAKAGTEALSLPLVENALEGHVPHPQDFVDAAMVICSLQGMAQMATHIPRLVPKLRHIYAATDKTPEEVVQAAHADPTIRQDLLSVNRGLPESLVSEAAEADAQARTEARSEARPEPPADVVATGERADTIPYQWPGESTTDAVQRYERRKEIAAPYMKQLQEVGYDAEHAEAYGQILAANAERMAEIHGITPEEYLKKNFSGYLEMTPEGFERLALEGLEPGQEANAAIFWDKVKASQSKVENVTSSTNVGHLTFGGHKDPTHLAFLNQWKESGDEAALQQAHDYAHKLSLSENTNERAKGHYILAKYHGDTASAQYTVNRVLFGTQEVTVKELPRSKAIKDLQSKIDPNKPVVFVPVANAEGHRSNALPMAYAEALARFFDGQVRTPFVKTSTKHGTNMSKAERMRHAPEFGIRDDANEIKDAQIVLVDDQWTSGNTVLALWEKLTNSRSATRKTALLSP